MERVGRVGVLLVLAGLCIAPALAQQPRPRPRATPVPRDAPATRVDTGIVEVTVDMSARIEVDGRVVVAGMTASAPVRITLAAGPHRMRAVAASGVAVREEEFEVKPGEFMRVDIRLAGVAVRMGGTAVAPEPLLPGTLTESSLLTVPSGEAMVGCGPTALDCGRTPIPQQTVKMAKGFQLTTSDAFQGVATGTSGWSWTNADAACRSVGGRLPTEEEWEFASVSLASAGTSSASQATDCADRLDWVSSTHTPRSDQRVARGPSIGVGCGAPRRLVLNGQVVYSNVNARCVVGSR